MGPSAQSILLSHFLTTPRHSISEDLLWERSWHAHSEIHSDIQGDKPEPNQYCRHPNLSSLLAHTRTNDVVCNWYEKNCTIKHNARQAFKFAGPKSEHQKLGQGLAGRKEEPYGNVGSKEQKLETSIGFDGLGGSF